MVTAARLLYTLVTAEVTSKTGALEWAKRLGRDLAPAAGQVRDDRTLGFDLHARPRLGSAEAAREFAAYAMSWAVTNRGAGGTQ